MTKKILLKIVTPERLILEEMVDQVTLPTTEGEITILPEHISLIAKLASGELVAVEAGEHIPMAITGGFLEVKNKDGETTVAVLADFAEHVSEMTDDAIAKAKARAEELRKLTENKETLLRYGEQSLIVIRDWNFVNIAKAIEGRLLNEKKRQN